MFKLNRLLNIIGLVEGPEDDYDRSYDERAYDNGRDQDDRATAPAGASYTPPPRPARNTRDEGAREEREHPVSRRTDNVRPFPQQPEPSASGHQETLVYYLRTLEDTGTIMDEVINHKIVLLNFEYMPIELVQRAIDVLFGAAYALKAKFRQSSQDTYLLVPYGIELTFNGQERTKYSYSAPRAR